MQVYANRHGDSGVQSFKIEEISITVEFTRSWKYVYDNVKPGAIHVNEMKRLAIQGYGLNEYINRFVKTNYARKYQ